MLDFEYGRCDEVISLFNGDLVVVVNVVAQLSLLKVLVLLHRVVIHRVLTMTCHP